MLNTSNLHFLLLASAMMMTDAAYITLAIPPISLSSHSRAQCRGSDRGTRLFSQPTISERNFASGANGELKLPGEMLEQISDRRFTHTSLTKIS